MRYLIMLSLLVLVGCDTGTSVPYAVSEPKEPLKDIFVWDGVTQDLENQELVKLISENWENQQPSRYQDIILIELPITGFTTDIALRSEVEEIHTEQTNLGPREFAKQERVPAGYVLAEIWSHEALVLNNCSKADTEWELVRITTSPVPGVPPQHPNDIIAFRVSAENDMTPEEFEQKLKNSLDWWEDKVEIKTEEVQDHE